MIVEPLVGNTLAENLNPVGRLYYASPAAHDIDLCDTFLWESGAWFVVFEG
jgi:hypothetical protein